jgi:hypothetical protein
MIKMMMIKIRPGAILLLLLMTIPTVEGQDLDRSSMVQYEFTYVTGVEIDYNVSV